MFRKLTLLSGLIGLLNLAGCSDSEQPVADRAEPDDQVVKQSQDAVQRWYSEQQVRAGKPLYQKYCAECHQPDASDTPNWRERGADGKFPPPPLNGTAHTWHHHLDGLRRTIRIGGVPLGGVMPAFGDKLSDREIDDILAWIQSHWPDQIYSSWEGINARAAP